MHLADDFFIRHQHGRENARLCVIITQNEGTEICDKNCIKPIDFIGDYRHSEAAKLKNCSPGNAARRFDWPAFRRALGNRPDKSPQPKPIRSRTQRAFLKSRDSTAVPSAPISETPVQCRRKLASDLQIAVCVGLVKTMSFNEVKEQEAQSRMAARARLAAVRRRRRHISNGLHWWAMVRSGASPISSKSPAPCAKWA